MTKKKVLLVTEKPSVKRAIEAVASKTGNSQFDFEFENFHGHLMELQQPEDYTADWKKWDASTLPMIPEAFIYKPSDVGSVNRIVNTIKKGGYDYIVNACDAGREGELIFWSFYESNHITTPVLRYWASSNTTPAITKALANLLPYKQFEGLKAASKLRAIMDWLVGMNLSRATSLSANTTCSVGRVMTPVSKMVVDREREISNFIVKNFYEIRAGMFKDGKKIIAQYIKDTDSKESRFDKKEDAQAILNSMSDEMEVVDVKEEVKETKPATLCSLATLQELTNKQFKLSPKQTLDCAQSLYEKGYTTYPRTESRYIPTDMVPEIMDHVKAVIPFKNPYGDVAAHITQPMIDKALTGNMYVDDSKIEDHHALIPTEKPIDMSDITTDEAKVYEIIVRQFLSIFLPSYVAKKVNATFSNNGHLFTASGTVVMRKGYSLLYGNTKVPAELPALSKGEVLKIVNKEVFEGKTTPPVRYTQAELLKAMQNAGRFVDDESQRKILKESAGLGTAATRADILEKLITKGFLILEKNSFRPSEFCMEFIDVFGEKKFSSPAFTAVWEDRFRAVENDKATYDEVLQEIIKYVSDETAELLKNDNDLSSFKYASIGKCPICGKRVLIKKNFYVCEDYKNPCKFYMPKIYSGASINENEARILINGGHTLLKNCTSKEGRPYKASFCLSEATNMLTFYNGNINEPIAKCPSCGGSVYEYAKGFGCEHNSLKDKSCDFYVAREICNAKFTASDIKNICAGKRVKKKFTWPSSQKEGFAEYGYKPDEKKCGFIF